MRASSSACTCWAVPESTVRDSVPAAALQDSTKGTCLPGTPTLPEAVAVKAPARGQALLLCAGQCSRGAAASAGARVMEAWVGGGGRYRVALRAVPLLLLLLLPCACTSKESVRAAARPALVRVTRALAKGTAEVLALAASVASSRG